MKNLKNNTVSSHDVNGGPSGNLPTKQQDFDIGSTSTDDEWWSHFQMRNDRVTYPFGSWEKYKVHKK